MKKIIELLRQGANYASGWRECIAEMDDMGKTEVQGKLMWCCLDQIDTWREEVLSALQDKESPAIPQQPQGEICCVCKEVRACYKSSAGRWFCDSCISKLSPVR